MVTIALALLAPFAIAAAILLLDSPRTPPAMTSVANVFDEVDFSDMPAIRTYAARDGTKLAYRLYAGNADRIAVLVHGSSGTSASMHALARAIHRRGHTVYSLAMRGHEGTGRSGDIDYIGQLDDDMADFLATLGARKEGQKRTLLGFSSGGGFALRFAGGPRGGNFDRLVLVAPQLPHTAPTSRPNAGGWVALAIPRIIILSLLSRIGINAFGGLRVLAMAVDPARAATVRQTPFYSFRMLQNFTAGDGYKKSLKKVRGPVAVFVGANDEIFVADKYAPLLKRIRPDVTVTIVPGMSHMQMTVKPAALDVLAAAI